jgi:hypothetical protein
MIIKVKIFLLQTLTGIIIFATFSNSINASGISVDAGLTPPEDRWILRTQVRYKERRDDPTNMNRKMETFSFPVVLAYGLRSDLTLLIRQRVISHKLSVRGTTERDEGLGDLFMLVKYRAYRLNTPDYTLGIAPTIGLEFPTGHDSFTSDTWNLKPGLFFSGRRGPWAVDLNIAYKWNGFADRGKGGRDPGDEVSLDLAFAHQFSIGGRGFASLAPVLELTYTHSWPDEKRGHDIDNTRETFFYLSPGIKFLTSSLILEALVQIPVWQDQKGSQLEQDVGILAGVRFLF